MLGESPWWLGRPSHRRALVSVAACVAIGAVVALVQGRLSPLATRALLPSEEVGEEQIYLTSLPDDPRRVLVTTKRDKSTLTRAYAEQPGARYWIHAYADPARPLVPPRLLLTSRSQGARLLVPAAAVDLGRALRTPVEASGEPWDASRGVRVRMVGVHRDRLYAGAYLELRFPERERDEESGDWIDQALVCVRENRVRTADFLLQPSDVLYRAYLAAGLMPDGDLVAHEDGELVFTLSERFDRPCVPLFVPFSLFDELALARGDELTEILDDRWRPAELPRVREDAPGADRVATAARLLAVHLAARIEPEPVRADLARRVEAWTGSVVP